MNSNVAMENGKNVREATRGVDYQLKLVLVSRTKSWSLSRTSRY